MIRLFSAALIVLAGRPLAMAETSSSIPVDPAGRVSYQAKPLANPKGGDRFRGSNFIHPIKTPSGFTVTDCQPADHLHHFGLWWPWKYVQVGERKVLCWELQKQDGLIRAVEHENIPGGILAKSVYLDRKAPGGPVEILQETAGLTVSDLTEHPASGYFLDIEITQQCAGDEPITVTPYRYSGFTFRGTAAWKRENSTILTSEGRDRDHAQDSKARWVRVEGAAGAGEPAGVLLMSHPGNRSHPEKLRTWDQQHGGAVFINFNSVKDEPWPFEPGKFYTRKYRLFVYDGRVTPEEAETLWSEYANL